MKRTQIQLTDEQAELLDDISTERGISKAEIIRNALDEWVKNGDLKTRKQRMEEARDGFGIVTSDDGDLSEQHDNYLIGAYDTR